ncbi:MAG: hypothetical protein ACRYFA_00495 [Janthinobacterium lividum]
MIAIISSTIKPLVQINHKRSFYTFLKRLEQTKQTLDQLVACAFTSIFLIDNSPSLNQLQLQQLLVDFPQVQVHHIQQYQFNNKGINELLMLLYVVKYLPLNQNIFKISGRYYPTASFEKPKFADFAVKGYQYKKRTGTISTRGYWVKDAEILQPFLLSCLAEIFAYPERITGIRSLYVKLQKILLNKQVTPLNISIEFAAANVLKNHNYRVSFLSNIGIAGLVAGANQIELITE